MLGAALKLKEQGRQG